MKLIRRITVTSLLVAVGLAGLASVSSAAPARIWAGTSFNDLGPATVTLKVRNGRAKITSLQILMACTDTSDGTESTRAFSMGRGPTDTLNLNRFHYRFDRESGGRDADVRLNGHLGSNGRGNARLNLTAVGRDFETSSVIERCQASTRFNLRRGPAR